MKLEHDRLILVPADESLAEELTAYYIRNREFLRAFEPERDEDFFKPELQRKLLAEEAAGMKQGTSYFFYMKRPENMDEIVGRIGFSNVFRGTFLSTFLGYKLDQDYVNQGYMTLAVEMMTNFAFGELGLHRIEGNVMPKNAASLRVLEKAGFVNEGISRKYLKINGKWEDHVHMVRLNEEMEE